MSRRHPRTTLASFKVLLDAHDWDFERADDPKAYRKGKAERLQLEELARGSRVLKGMLEARQAAHNVLNGRRMLPFRPLTRM